MSMRQSLDSDVFKGLDRWVSCLQSYYVQCLSQNRIRRRPLRELSQSLNSKCNGRTEADI